MEIKKEGNSFKSETLGFSKGFEVSVSRGLSFAARNDSYDSFLKSNKKLQDFVRKLEKKFGEAIWYIGTDILDSGIYERFMFNHGGFMEIKVGSEGEIRAHFGTKEKADRFENAIEEAKKA